jgi:plasmid maintenance system antidote protein VapI
LDRRGAIRYQTPPWTGTRAVSADTALRLARFFGTSDRFWLNLQASYDLDVERDRLGERIKRDVPVFRKAG